MKKYFVFLFFLIFSNFLFSIVNFPPPNGCANGCDQTAGYPTSACFQCPTGAAEDLKCIGDGSATVPGHLCNKKLYNYGYPYGCMCDYTCDGCTSSVYQNFVGLSVQVVPKAGGFDLYMTIPYQAPCHWCLSNPWGCASAGLCVIQDYDPSKNCSNARLQDKFCEPRFEQGIWYPVFGAACSSAGSTLNFSAKLERCTGSSCPSSAVSSPVSVEIPLALESGCSSSPDWDCCDEEGSSCVGGPINISSGNMHYEETDISIDDPANFIFTRAYNNQETNLNITGAIMGYGWTHNFNQRLVLTNSLSDGRRIYRWLKGDGRKNYFLETSPYSNYFASYWPYGGKETMEDNGTTLTITDLNRNTINFDKTTGLWLSSCDFYGNCSTGAYSGGKLSQVTDPYGRTITFTYNGSNRLIEVTLWDGTTKWRYAYDSTNNYLT